MQKIAVVLLLLLAAGFTGCSGSNGNTYKYKGYTYLVAEMPDDAPTPQNPVTVQVEVQTPEGDSCVVEFSNSGGHQGSLLCNGYICYYKVLDRDSPLLPYTIGEVYNVDGENVLVLQKEEDCPIPDALFAGVVRFLYHQSEPPLYRLGELLRRLWLFFVMQGIAFVGGILLIIRPQWVMVQSPNPVPESAAYRKKWAKRVRQFCAAALAAGLAMFGLLWLPVSTGVVYGIYFCALVAFTIWGIAQNTHHRKQQP